LGLYKWVGLGIGNGYRLTGPRTKGYRKIKEEKIMVQHNNYFTNKNMNIQYLNLGILHSTHLNKNLVLEISIKRGMIKIKLREKIKLPHHFSLHRHFTTLPLRALISATSFRMKWPISKDKIRK